MRDMMFLGFGRRPSEPTAGGECGKDPGPGQAPPGTGPSGGYSSAAGAVSRGSVPTHDREGSSAGGREVADVAFAGGAVAEQVARNPGPRHPRENRRTDRSEGLPVAAGRGVDIRIVVGERFEPGALFGEEFEGPDPARARARDARARKRFVQDRVVADAEGCEPGRNHRRGASRPRARRGRG
jgi:hypothetical protein